MSLRCCDKMLLELETQTGIQKCLNCSKQQINEKTFVCFKCRAPESSIMHINLHKDGYTDWNQCMNCLVVFRKSELVADFNNRFL